MGKTRHESAKVRSVPEANEPKEPLRQFIRRILAFVWAVMRHLEALTITVIGSTLISVPSWIRSLLSEQGAKSFDRYATLSPQTYRYLAVAFLFFGFMYASFLAWNEERDEVSALKKERAERGERERNPIHPLLVRALDPDRRAQHEHTEAMKDLADAMRRGRKKDGPNAR